MPNTRAVGIGYFRSPRAQEVWATWLCLCRKQTTLQLWGFQPVSHQVLLIFSPHNYPIHLFSSQLSSASLSPRRLQQEPSKWFSSLESSPSNSSCIHPCAKLILQKHSFDHATLSQIGKIKANILRLACKAPYLSRVTFQVSFHRTHMPAKLDYSSFVTQTFLPPSPHKFQCT